MTKEPIMIHDVNVAECEYHSLNKFGHILCDLEKNPIVRSQGRLCEQNPICPYKVRYDLIQKLKRKEQECEELRQVKKDLPDIQMPYVILYRQIKEQYYKLEQECEDLREELEWVHGIKDQLKAENKKMSKGYEKLTEIVSPYIDDFTGYNEELKGFDIVLCVKELMQQLDALETENEKLRQYKASKQASYETMQKEWNDAKNKVKQLKSENEHLSEKEEEARHYLKEAFKLKQALQEIKDYCNKYPQNSIGFKKQILQKCEVIND